MHKVIRVMVDGDDPTEGMKNGIRALNKLCREKKTVDINPDNRKTVRNEEGDIVVNHHGSFDYFTLFDHDGSSVSGRGRFGNRTPIAPLHDDAEDIDVGDSPIQFPSRDHDSTVYDVEGREIVHRAWETQKQEYSEAIEALRYLLNEHTHREIIEEDISLDDVPDGAEFKNMPRYYANKIGTRKDREHYVFVAYSDDSASPIRTYSKLEESLSNEDAWPGRKDYVVQADVHH